MNFLISCPRRRAFSDGAIQLAEHRERSKVRDERDGHATGAGNEMAPQRGRASALPFGPRSRWED